MRKNKKEIKHIASVITAEKGKCFFNMKEVAAILGISRETAREVLETVPYAKVGNSKKFFIEDVLENVYK